MIGHVGSRVSALVDGQLPAAEADRLWAHVHGCDPCRRQVEREGWVKTRLAGLAWSGPPSTPDHLRGSLASVTTWPPPVGAASPGPAVPPPDRRRPVLVAAIGAGSAGAALAGVLAVAVPANTPGLDRAPVTSLTRPTATSSTTTTPTTSTTTGPRASLPPGTMRESSAIALLPHVGAALQKWVTFTP